MRALLADVRITLRQFRRQPRLAFAIASTLGLTIGMNVAVFSVVHAVMFRALPFAAPERLVWIASVRTDNSSAPFTLPEYLDYRAQARTLTGIAAYANWSASLEGQGITERFQGARMSANSFEILGLAASAGRLLKESDDAPDAPAVVVLSDRLWQRQFGGDPGIVGRSLRINGESLVVAGIMPRHFPLPLQGIDVVVPLTPGRDPLRFARGSVNFLRLFGRLQTDATERQAQAELTSICQSLRQQYPKEYARKESVRLTPLGDAVIGGYRQSLLLLLASAAIVLATALANLVSLVLIRVNDRRPELAVRVALGASRWDLVRQLTVEASLLTIVGSIAGCLLAAWAIAVMMPWLPASIPRLDEVRVDRRVLFFAVALTAIATVLLSLAPLGAIVRRRASDGLRLNTRGAVGDRWNHLARQVLVAGEIATALVLLLTTAGLIDNVQQLQRVHPGFEAEHVFQARVSVPARYQSPEAIVRFYERLSDGLSVLPGVRQVGVISVAPLSGLLSTVPFTVDGAGDSDDRNRPSANLRVITPGYLAAVGTRLLAGRSLAETDRPDSPPVVLVSAALANRFLSAGPLGRRLLIDDNSTGPRPVEVVGVVEDVRQTALDTPPTFDVYMPLRQLHPDNVDLIRNNQFWMIGVATDPAGLREPFLTALRAADRDAAISNMGPLRAAVDAWFGPRRFNLGLFVAFSLTAVALAVSGVYALVSYTVSQRRLEIGLRMAIGATEAAVYRMILGQAGRLASIGLAAGVCVAFVASPLISQMFSGQTLDPWLGALAAGLLTAVVVAAAWLPARRATRIHPSLALRGD